MFHVYIIYSPSLDEYYIGSTGNLQDRLYRHRNSGSKSTKKAKDWELRYSESFQERSMAVRREMEIKKKKDRNYIRFLISTSPG